MEINTTNPVSNQVQGLEITPKVSEVKREDEEAASRQAEAENPDYRINLSEASKKAIAELTQASSGPGQATNDISEDEAEQLSQQAAEQLAKTNASISDQAIQKAVDLFT